MYQKKIKFIVFLLVSIILITLNFNIFDRNLFKSFRINQKLNLNISGNKQYSTQWIKNSNFSSQESWFYLKGGDTSDTNASIHSEQAHFEILGKKNTFSLISDPPLALNWTECDNPDYPNRPQYYDITTEGCSVSHLYNDQTAVTNPSIHWDRNVSLPLNMSDFIITSASIKAIVYANASLDIDRAGDTEARNDLLRSLDTYDVGDYVRFYVLISDLKKEKIYEIAYLQPEDLGTGDPPGGPPGEDILPNTYMISYPEEDLIFYLSSVLNTDYSNFTLTLGMLLHFEDNIIADWDYDQFNELIIKKVNLTFSFEKKIDQSSFISWNQNLSKLCDISSHKVELLDAEFNFKYKIDQNWTQSSPNTEIRIFINNIRVPEPVELIEYNYTSYFQAAKIDGFNVKSFISENENISVSIQLYLADEFELDEIIKISIDDVFLNISYIEYIPSKDHSSFILLTIISILFIIIGILSILSLRSYVLLPQKKKRQLNLLLRTQKFKDVRNIQAIFLMHSESGLPIFSRTYTNLMKGKKTIFSGFIQALSIVSEEIFNKEPKKTDLDESEHIREFQKIIELDLKYFQCLVLNINELRTVLILENKSSKRLKRQMTHFAFAAYLQISKSLEHWNHDVKPYEKIIPPLLNQYFDLYYKDFFKLTNRELNIQKVKNQFKLNKYEYRILKIVYSISKENSYIKLMNLLEKVSGKNEELIIDALESLIKHKLIYPVTF
ncbi:MAG: hypothetical protein ACFFAQ_12155 [Promethearchaeota archaeon]